MKYFIAFCLVIVLSGFLIIPLTSADFTSTGTISGDRDLIVITTPVVWQEIKSFLIDSYEQVSDWLENAGRFITNTGDVVKGAWYCITHPREGIDQVITSFKYLVGYLQYTEVGGGEGYRGGH